MSKMVDKINNLQEGTAIVVSIVDDVHNAIDIVKETVNFINEY